MHLLQGCRLLWPRQNPRRQPEETQSAWKSFGSTTETSASATRWWSEILSHFIVRWNPLSHAFTSSYCSVFLLWWWRWWLSLSQQQNQPQECLGISQVIAIMSFEPFEVISCVTSWYYKPFPEQISSSIIERQGDFISKYCCNTLGKRLRASTVCRYHTNRRCPFGSMVPRGLQVKSYNSTFFLNREGTIDMAAWRN